MHLVEGLQAKIREWNTRRQFDAEDAKVLGTFNGLLNKQIITDSFEVEINGQRIEIPVRGDVKIFIELLTRSRWNFFIAPEKESKHTTERIYIPYAFSSKPPAIAGLESLGTVPVFMYNSFWAGVTTGVLFLTHLDKKATSDGSDLAPGFKQLFPKVFGKK